MLLGALCLACAPLLRDDKLPALISVLIVGVASLLTGFTFAAARTS